MFRPIKTFLCLSMVILAMAACTSRPVNVSDSHEQPRISPDYIGVTVPVNIAPLVFAMTDDSFTTVDVQVEGSNGGSLTTNGSHTDFDIDEWRELLHKNRGGLLWVTVCAQRDDGLWTRYRPFIIHISNELLE